jgi:hypothetical protein
MQKLFNYRSLAARLSILGQVLPLKTTATPAAGKSGKRLSVHEDIGNDDYFSLTF